MESQIDEVKKLSGIEGSKNELLHEETKRFLMSSSILIGERKLVMWVSHPVFSDIEFQLVNSILVSSFLLKIKDTKNASLVFP